LAVISLPVSAFNQPKSYPLEISESREYVDERDEIGVSAIVVMKSLSF
jgi:hypothetical protein